MSDDKPAPEGTIPEPSAEHRLLEPFAGTFKTEVRIWMGPGDPMVTTGTMHNTLDLGGMFLRHEYQGDAPEGPFPAFEGRGFWGYNAVTGQYEGFWIDNASSVMQLEYGDVDDSGKIWNMRGEIPDPRSGATLRRRSVITLIDDDHHKIESFIEHDGEELRAMELVYERADSA